MAARRFVCNRTLCNCGDTVRENADASRTAGGAALPESTIRFVEAPEGDHDE